VELKTKRLILRGPKLRDWEDIVEGAGDYDISKMTISIPYPYKKKDAEYFIKSKIGELKKAKPNAYLFFIELRSEKKVIGAVEIFKINRFAGTGEIGFWINKKYWRNGYMTEAQIALNNFVFNKIKLRRLDSFVFCDNEASNATHKKMGYVLEGRMRKINKSKATGEIHDANIYGLLKEDWVKTKGKLIKKIINHK
jgi:[ribosomal protein S5]-alanine N-acetyltransferase